MKANLIRINGFRIIARLDIKNDHVIKGIHLEGLRKVGTPLDFARKYYSDGIDEILFMDAVASLYGRNNIQNVIAESTKEVFIPMTIGGGIRTLDDVKSALSSGADKIALNTAIVKDPSLITTISRKYGSQCCVCSIEAKKVGSSWEVYTENGREPSGKDVLDWIRFVNDQGAGEILLTSIDQEGTKKGFDLKLYEMARKVSKIPIIASGGAGTLKDIEALKASGYVDGVALASLLHYNIATIEQIKLKLIS